MLYEVITSDLVSKVAESTELSKKDATKAVDAVFEAISEALQSGDKVQLVGFGNFEVRERSARKGRNPQTGEEIEIPASKIPAFKPGRITSYNVCYTKLLRIITAGPETPRYEKYRIDMIQMHDKGYIEEIPSAAFEQGGSA